MTLRLNSLALAGALTLTVSSAPASTIQNFEIVTAAGLSPTGGVFNDNATFAGTFSVDLSQLPTGGADALLPAVQIVTSNGLLTGEPYTAGDIVDNGTATVFGVTLQSYLLHMRAQDGINAYTLNLEFVDVPGTFTGGQIVSAVEVCRPCDDNKTLRLERDDSSGDALAVDPALAAPEPSTAPTCAAALLSLWLFRRGRRGGSPDRAL